MDSTVRKDPKDTREIVSVVSQRKMSSLRFDLINVEERKTKLSLGQHSLFNLSSPFHDTMRLIRVISHSCSVLLVVFDSLAYGFIPCSGDGNEWRKRSAWTNGSSSTTLVASSATSSSSSRNSSSSSSRKDQFLKTAVSGPPLETKPDYENIVGPLGRWMDTLFLVIFRQKMAEQAAKAANHHHHHNNMSSSSTIHQDARDDDDDDASSSSRIPLTDYRGIIAVAADMNRRSTSRTEVHD